MEIAGLFLSATQEEIFCVLGMKSGNFLRFEDEKWKFFVKSGADLRTESSSGRSGRTLDRIWTVWQRVLATFWRQKNGSGDLLEAKKWVRGQKNAFSTLFLPKKVSKSAIFAFARFGVLAFLHSSKKGHTKMPPLSKNRKKHSAKLKKIDRPSPDFGPTFFQGGRSSTKNSHFLG